MERRAIDEQVDRAQSVQMHIHSTKPRPVSVSPTPNHHQRHLREKSAASPLTSTTSTQHTHTPQHRPPETTSRCHAGTPSQPPRSSSAKAHGSLKLALPPESALLPCLRAPHHRRHPHPLPRNHPHAVSTRLSSPSATRIVWFPTIGTPWPVEARILVLQGTACSGQC